MRSCIHDAFSLSRSCTPIVRSPALWLMVIISLMACDQTTDLLPPDTETADQMIRASSFTSLGDISNIGVHTTARNSTSEQSAMLDTAGISRARVDIYWWNIEYTDDVFNWNETGLVDTYNNLKARGIEMIGNFALTPPPRTRPGTTTCEAWAANNGVHEKHCPPAPSHYDDYQEFVDSTMKRFPEIDDWEVWNEAFSEKAQYGGGVGQGIFYEGTPEVLDTLIARAALVLPAGDRLFCCGFVNTSGSHDNDFASELYANNRSYLDGISLHTYGWGVPSMAGTFVREVGDEITNNGDGTPSILITEFGSSQGSSPDSTTEGFLRDLFEATLDSMETNSQFEHAYYYHWDATAGNNASRWIVDPGTGETVDSVRIEPYCYLVLQAGNEELDDRCLNAEITTPNGTMVPPHTDCLFQGQADDGTSPFSYKWYPDGVYQGDTGTSLTYTTPSSGSFDMGFQVTDANGLTDTHWVTYTVDQMAMCVQ